LLAKELWGVLSGRALWTMLLILCPLVGYSFFQAVSLYGEASLAARDSPVLATGLSPLDGVLVPTFGALYLAVTLLFPFVAIRALGREKETGALRLLVQLPYSVPTLIAAKLAAIAVAWLIAIIPALSALAIWAMLGGHLQAPETLNLLLGTFNLLPVPPLDSNSSWHPPQHREARCVDLDRRHPQHVMGDRHRRRIVIDGRLPDVVDHPIASQWASDRSREVKYVDAMASASFISVSSADAED